MSMLLSTRATRMKLLKITRMVAALVSRFKVQTMRNSSNF